MGYVQILTENVPSSYSCCRRVLCGVSEAAAVVLVQHNPDSSQVENTKNEVRTMMAVPANSRIYEYAECIWNFQMNCCAAWCHQPVFAFHVWVVLGDQRTLTANGRPERIYEPGWAESRRLVIAVCSRNAITTHNSQPVRARKRVYIENHDNSPGAIPPTLHVVHQNDSA